MFQWGRKPWIHFHRQARGGDAGCLQGVDKVRYKGSAHWCVSCHGKGRILFSCSLIQLMFSSTSVLTMTLWRSITPSSK